MTVASDVHRQRRRSATGRSAEAVAAEHLIARGWRVLARNVRVGRSELDLLVVDPGPPAVLVIVEVRANRGAAFGAPEEGVGRAKLRAVYRGAYALRASRRLPDGTLLPRLPIRVDLMAVELGPTIGRELRGTVIRHVRSLIG